MRIVAAYFATPFTVVAAVVHTKSA